MSATSTELEPTVVDYDDPAVQALLPGLQREYVRRYGGEDDTPLTTAELRPPTGIFLLIRRNGAPVAMGGWRRHDEARSGRVPGERAVEIKRMYVVPEARGLGLARRLLTELERLAVAAGADWMVLESGQAQPEALALYRSCGYADVPAFGHYCASDQSVHLGKPVGE